MVISNFYARPWPSDFEVKSRRYARSFNDTGTNRCGNREYGCGRWFRDISIITQFLETGKPWMRFGHKLVMLGCMPCADGAIKVEA